MSFASNSSQQISLFDTTATLTAREQRMLEKSWSKYFSEHIFPAIEEEPFRVLYSERPSRFNTPVNVIIGALIIKELFGLTDDEIVETLPFDIRFQYALHTTSFQEQPLNDRTLGRFRARCNAYTEQTGIDLIQNCIVSLSEKMAEMIGINSGLRRMDSLMVASNIKKMSRLELLYTCVANMCKVMHKRKESKYPEELKCYLEEDNHNKVLYHNRSEETESKMEIILKHLLLLKELCATSYQGTQEYQLLLRVISEQTKEDGSKLTLKGKGEMNAVILQNPADPEATYRKKPDQNIVDILQM